ncbi:hypothetical protein [Pseudooceanicola sp. MF1-13]|uniref:hypothetical protein n=1 Tax=Pseudooceanicola sp. MF1-13 TaxID=3379095 RepID=UPI003891B35F
MIRVTSLTVLLMATAAPVLADCATDGLRVRCIYVGDDKVEIEQPGEDAPERISARFVTANQRNSAEAVAQRFKTVAARRVTPMEPTYKPGDTLPADVLIMLNPVRHGLPRPRDGWTYFTVGREVYRADLRSRQVLDFVNPHISLY